jgi:hypothetical protein
MVILRSLLLVLILSIDKKWETKKKKHGEFRGSRNIKENAPLAFSGGKGSIKTQ